MQMTLKSFAVSVFPGIAQTAHAAKAEICHVTPGQSGKFHTNTVNENAVGCFKNHGDMVDGPCGLFCEQLLFL